MDCQGARGAQHTKGEMVRSICADHIVDCTREDFTRGRARYDVFTDNFASCSLSAAWLAPMPTGIHVPRSGHAGVGWIIAAGLAAIFLRRQEAPFVAVTSSKNLLALGALIEAGNVVAIVDRIYRLDETAKAFAYLDERHAHDKVVVVI